MAFLDQSGLQKVFTKLKSLIDQKADASSIGNGTITITQNGKSKGSFTVNQSGSTTIALTDTNTDTNTWQANTVSQNGYVSAPTTSNANKVWKTDASGNPGWRADSDTTYSNMSGATTSAAGVRGLVPAPAAGAANRYLRSDGTWQVPPDTNTNTWNANTVSVAGYVSAPGTSNANKVWKTDASGNPGWRDDANTTALTSMTGTLTVAHGGTGATAKGTTLLSNIGITTGTAAPAATGTAGTIYIQYA